MKSGPPRPGGSADLKHTSVSETEIRPGPSLGWSVLPPSPEEADGTGSPLPVLREKPHHKHSKQPRGPSVFLEFHTSPMEAGHSWHWRQLAPGQARPGAA